MRGVALTDDAESFMCKFGLDGFVEGCKPGMFHLAFCSPSLVIL